MADDPKTLPTDADVTAYLAGVDNAQRRADAHVLCARLADWTGEPAVMWGPSIVGFGSYHYRYATGREGDTFAVGFAPRKQQLVIYLDGYDEEETSALLAKLGPHSTGKGCLYVKRLADVDSDVLRQLVQQSQAKRVAREQGTAEKD